LKHTTPTDPLNVPVPLTRLFALHANFGPLAGFDNDVKRAGDFMSTPKLQYAMSRVALRQGNAEKAASGRKDAFDAGGDWRAGRFETGRYLAENGWDEEAEAEFKAYLAMPAADDPVVSEASDVNAHFALSDLAARRGDDFTAAEQKKAAMSILGGGTNAPLEGTDALGHDWPITEDSIWAEVHWLYLKAALKRKDETAVGAELKALIQLKPSDEDMAIDVAPLLKSRGQADAADQFFAAAYKVAHGKLAVDPTNPSLMNGVAWLEAKCDENLSEALRLATSAVAADPDNSAMIDTLAEVNFHLGNFSRAVELETRALKLTPGDTFMAGQLERFKASLGK
jgi:predicted Zn-dependent protease